MPLSLYAIAGLALALLLSIGWGAYEHQRVATQTVRADAAEQRTADAEQQVRAATATVSEAKRLNSQCAAAVDTQNAAVAAQQARGAALEKQAHEAMAKAKSAAEALAAADRARQAETGNPKPEEMTRAYAEWAGRL